MTTRCLCYNYGPTQKCSIPEANDNAMFTIVSPNAVVFSSEKGNGADTHMLFQRPLYIVRSLPVIYVWSIQMKKTIYENTLRCVRKKN